MLRVSAWALAALLASACDRQPSCHFGEVEVVAETLPESTEAAEPYLNVTVARVGEKELIAFTGAAGLEYVWWDAEHGAEARGVLGDRCAALTNVVLSEQHVSLVCSVAGSPAKEQEGAVVVYDLARDLGVRRRSAAAPIGSSDEGIGAAVNPLTSELEVVFASGATGAWHAMHLSMGTFGSASSSSTLTTVSRGQPVFSAPAIWFRDQTRLIYFSDFVPDRTVEVTELTGALLVQRTDATGPPHRAPRVVEEIRVAASTPIVTANGALLFQDVRRPHTFPSLFLREATEREEVSTRLMRGALARSLPRAADCGDGLAVAMPRSFDGDALVRVAFLDSQYAPGAPETEVYEYGGHLFAVDLYCEGASTTVVTSARYTVESKSARIYRVPIRCEE